MRRILWSALLLCCMLVAGTAGYAADDGEKSAAPKTLPERIASGWTRARGADGQNLIYVEAAAEKFNLPATVLAAALLTDLLTHHKDWEAWAADHAEVRSEGSLVHIAGASALAEGLLRTDLVIPEARVAFEKKRNDINYMLNPQPGVDHWYQSCLEAATSLMSDEGVAIGTLGRQLRRTATGTYSWSAKLQEPYSRITEESLERLLSQARAWPEDAEYEWPLLLPGREPWSVPTFALVYGRYRMRAFDAEPHDELLSLAAQVYQWVLANPAIVEALSAPADAPDLVPYKDPTEDYSFH